MNINLHSSSKQHSLGLVRIEGTLPSEKVVDLVENQMEKFDLNLESDVAATITDGASSMMKFGRLTSPEHITCLAHAVHLSICDVLYKKDSPSSSSCNRNADIPNDDDL